jgi:hypothetical protein
MLTERAGADWDLGALALALTCRCARGASTPASSKVGAVLPAALPSLRLVQSSATRIGVVIATYDRA